MIVDTSAIVAIVAGQAPATHLAEILWQETAPKMSVATGLEINAIFSRQIRPEDQRRIQRLFGLWQVIMIPVDAQQAEVASRAYRDYGRGSGHPAALNLGDCFSY